MEQEQPDQTTLTVNPNEPLPDIVEEEDEGEETKEEEEAKSIVIPSSPTPSDSRIFDALDVNIHNIVEQVRLLRASDVNHHQIINELNTIIGKVLVVQQDLLTSIAKLQDSVADIDVKTRRVEEDLYNLENKVRDHLSSN